MEGGGEGNSAAADEEKVGGDGEDGADGAEGSLDHADTRRGFITDLLEMECFFQMRAQELETIDHVVAFNQFSDAEPVLRNQTAALMQEHLAAVQACLSGLQVCVAS